MMEVDGQLVPLRSLGSFVIERAAETGKVEREGREAVWGMVVIRFVRDAVLQVVLKSGVVLHYVRPLGNILIVEVERVGVGLEGCGSLCHWVQVRVKVKAVARFFKVIEIVVL
jgi:hypothetical protein